MPEEGLAVAAGDPEQAQPAKYPQEVMPEEGLAVAAGDPEQAQPAKYPQEAMPEEGLEPSRDCSHRILSPARLPVPPLRLQR